MLKQFLKENFRSTSFYEHAAAFYNRNATYSQFGEDAHIGSYYDRLRYERGIDVGSGLAVDVGAYRPILYSNTYKFYKKGWMTINIDPTPGFKLLFDNTRPKDINLEIAIGPEDGTKTFYLFGKPSVFNTMDPTAAREVAAKTGIDPIEIPIPVRRLESVLDEHAGELPFELLSIDAEGLDIEIIQSANLARYQPRVVLVENHDMTREKMLDCEIFVLMSDLGYKLHSWINPNLMFVRADSWLAH